MDCNQVFNKLVVTSLKYTPMVLKHHIPYKELPDGRLYVLIITFFVSLPESLL